MFLGQFRHSLDSKDRLTIPARFREELEDGAYVMQGFDRNLMVHTADNFDHISHSVSQMSLTDPTKRLLNRLIFSTAGRVDIDKAGRILIPEFLRLSAGLQEEAVIVGAGDYFEIWSPESWADQESLLQDTQTNAQRFAAFDIVIG
jgi:MraZ protein